MSDFLDRLGLTQPIIQAPMAGGFTSPDFVAAVSAEGAQGSLGAAYMTAEQIGDAVARIRSLTGRPFGINLFSGGYATRSDVDPAPMLALFAEIHAELGLPAPVLPKLAKDPFAAQLPAVLEAQPRVFSFTFGLPPAAAIAALKARDIVILGTATNVAEAKALADLGVDAIVAQGEEAGGHRGTFIGSFEDAMVPTLDLVSQIKAAFAIPVIAAGGLMDGRDIAKALAHGAVAAQLGTAFIACPEAGTAQTHKQALLNAKTDTTEITRAYSGRPARGLHTAFMARTKPEFILPFPQQNDLTRPMRGAAAKLGKADYLSLWAGRGVTRSRALPLKDLVRTLAAELQAA